MMYWHPLIAVSVSFFSSGRWFQVWGKTEEKIYGPDAGTDYKDNQLRFSLLCQVRRWLIAVLVLQNSDHLYHCMY